MLSHFKIFNQCFIERRMIFIYCSTVSVTIYIIIRSTFEVKIGTRKHFFIAEICKLSNTLQFSPLIFLHCTIKLFEFDHRIVQKNIYGYILHLTKVGLLIIVSTVNNAMHPLTVKLYYNLVIMRKLSPGNNTGWQLLLRKFAIYAI